LTAGKLHRENLGEACGDYTSWFRRAYDMAVAADLMQASAVMAVSAYELANLSGMIPRGNQTEPTPVQAVKVSDSLIVKGKGSY